MNSQRFIKHLISSLDSMNEDGALIKETAEKIKAAIYEAEVDADEELPKVGPKATARIARMLRERSHDPTLQADIFMLTREIHDNSKRDKATMIQGFIEYLRAVVSDDVSPSDLAQYVADYLQSA